MTIIGLTDQVIPKFPTLGKLRKGGPSVEKQTQSGKTYNTYGEDLDHFRFTSKDKAVAEVFAAAYGDQPAQLSVFLPYRTPEECFQTSKEKWSAGGMVHRCNGRIMSVWREGKGYARGEKPCPYYGVAQTDDQKKQDPPCDEVGRLEVILPELFKAGYIGYVTMETHSIHDIRNIQAALELAYQARQDLRGIQFTLCRVLQDVSTPRGEGKRVRQDKWLVFLYPSVKWAQLQLAMSQSLAMRLPTPTTETVDAETGEVFGGDFDTPVTRADDPAVTAAIAQAVTANRETAAALQAQAAENKAKVDAEIAKARAALTPPAAPAKPAAPAAPAQPAKPANGNGDAKKPAAGAKDELTIALEAFSKLRRFAQALGVTVENFNGDPDLATVKARSKALGDALFAQAVKILPLIYGGWPRRTSTLDAAVKQLEENAA